MPVSKYSKPVLKLDSRRLGPKGKSVVLVTFRPSWFIQIDRFAGLTKPDVPRQGKALILQRAERVLPAVILMPQVGRLLGL